MSVRCLLNCYETLLCHRRCCQINVHTVHIWQVGGCVGVDDIQYHTHKMEQKIMLPLKMLNKQLPNVLWNISFPFCLKSFWHLGVTFSKKSSCDEVFPLMALTQDYQTATVSARFGHSCYSALGQQPKRPIGLIMNLTTS